MKDLCQFGIVVFCLITTSCAGRYAQPPRENIIFDYVPSTEAPPGSADVTFAIVGAEFVAPTTHQQELLLQRGILLPSAPPPPLFQQLISNMTKDFEEVLTARGFAVKGSYRILNEMIYPDKEGSDLILTAKVRFSANTSGFRYTDEKGKIILSGCVMTPVALAALVSASLTPQNSDKILLSLIGGGLGIGAVILGSQGTGFIPSGQVQVGCEVELEAYEGLTGELMWSKSLPIPSFTVTPTAIKREDPGVITWQQLMETDNSFYSDIGRVFESQYDEILNKIYIYLDPREMAIVKNQAMELRKRKVY